MHDVLQRFEMNCGAKHCTFSYSPAIFKANAANSILHMKLTEAKQIENRILNESFRLYFCATKA